MITRIQAVHFDASQQLQDFVEKKVSKLEKLCEGAGTLEVTMKLIKPETAMKVAKIKTHRLVPLNSTPLQIDSMVSNSSSFS